MYAIGSPGDEYHLLTQTDDQTLCGLGVAPIVIDRTVDTSDLHLTTNTPTDREMCKRCARIAGAGNEQG
jgi:hypothetical protein